MRVIFPTGLANRHPHPVEPDDHCQGISRGLAALILATAFPVGSVAKAQNAQAVQPVQPSPADQPALLASQPSPPSLSPSMTGPLHANPDPFHFDGGPLGPIYVSGVISALGLTEDHPAPADRKSRIDVSNWHLIFQNAEGLVQFYVQAGAYSQPSLGTPYFTDWSTTRQTYGLIPVAYVKIAPSSDFNIQAGKLLTLQGGENTFTFQNFNVERGLLWNQTNAINRGIQANYSHGPLSISLSLNDGYYSAKYNWLSGTIGYTLSSKDSVTLGASGSLSSNAKSTFATPTVLNNGQLYFLSWTHTDGPWTVQPYVQFGHVPRRDSVGIEKSASTYGGAILGKYSFNKEIALAARAELIKSTGSPADGAPSLVYGPGSGAWSLTLTPTFQKGVFFARAEGSYVRAFKVVPGFGLGRDFDKKSQLRGLIEAGVIF